RMDQFIRRGFCTFGIARTPAIFDPDVTAIGPAQLLERIEERRDAGLALTIGLRVTRDQHPYPPELLRARRKWPRRRAAEQRDELAAFQLIELHHQCRQPEARRSNP